MTDTPPFNPLTVRGRLHFGAVLFVGFLLTIQPGQDPDPVDKIDPAVRTAMETAGSVQVFLLARRQLLEPVGGLEHFAAGHASADRRQLRSQVIAELKRPSSTFQEDIRRKLGPMGEIRPVWIVNGFLASLSADQIKRAARMPEVAYVYPAQEQFPPFDTTARFPLAPSPSSPVGRIGQRIAWYLDSLQVPRVWSELSVRGTGVVVASLDVGANYLHQDLRSHLWVNPREVPGNGRDDDGNGYPDDIYGFDFGAMSPNVRDTNPQLQHGTITAGIAVGDGRGGVVTGVAPEARLMVLKSGSLVGSMLAYQYALENGADVLSMSFSLPNLGNVRGLWRMMSDHAVAAGLVPVGGAGNFRISAALPAQVQSPKDVPSVIAVGGVDSTLTIAPFSSGGPAEWGSVALYGDYRMPAGIVKPDVVAFPGAGYPILASGDSGYLDPNLRVKGNSFSGPQGAGVAALMLSAAPWLPAWRVSAIMQETARDLGPKGKDNDFGAGLLNAYAAVKRARASRSGSQ